MFANKRCFVLITGASRGLGRAISISLAEQVGDDSAFLLLSRTEKDLEETKETLMHSFAPKKLQVTVKSVDNLSADRQIYESCINSALGHGGSTRFESAVLVHNAGSLGPQGTLVKDSFDPDVMQKYFSTNLFSVMMLNAAFLSAFSTCQHRLIVNISSLAALQPFETWSFYCMGKSARDMLFKVLAAEEKEDEKLRILNYAPGPLDTAMIKEVITSSKTSSSILESVTNMKNTGALLTPAESSTKLIKILNMDVYKNGDHVDYFDIE